MSGESITVTPALRRRFVSRNWCFGFAGHSVYDLSGTLYAVMGTSGAETITATCPAVTSGEGGSPEAFEAFMATMSEAWDAANPAGAV